MYLAKNIEGAVLHYLLSPRQELSASPDLSASNIAAAKKIGENLQRHFAARGLKINAKASVLKPKIETTRLKGPEPKADIVLITSCDQRFPVSLKKDTQNSGVANFTTRGSFLATINMLIEDGVAGADAALARADELFALKLGVHNMINTQHRPVFVKDLNRPNMNNGHGIPQRDRQVLLEMFDARIIQNQYEDLITKPQQGLRQWINEMYHDNHVFFRELIVECMSGQRKFGDTDAAAKFVANIHGVFTPDEYYPHYMAAKFARKNGDVGRVRKGARTGLGAYDARLTIEENFDRLTRAAAMAAF